jgi:hypothetical protein
LQESLVNRATFLEDRLDVRTVGERIVLFEKDSLDLSRGN